MVGVSSITVCRWETGVSKSTVMARIKIAQLVNSKSADFYIGFAAALGVLVRTFDQPGIARDIMQSCGVTIDEICARLESKNTIYLHSSLAIDGH